MGFFKTKICRFAASGRCKHGTACRFAHNLEELSCYNGGQTEMATEEEMAAQMLDMEGSGTIPSSPGTTTQTGSEQEGQSSIRRPSIRQQQIAEGAHSDIQSDQSTRADTGASLPTPEGSGDSGQEETLNSPQMQKRGGGSDERTHRMERRSAENTAGRTRHCTTMMITNVPNFLTQGALVSLLEDLTTTLRGAFDFFYCPWDPYEDRNLGYAIINFFSRSVASDFERTWANKPLLASTRGSKKLRIVPAALQGRAANLRHFSGFNLAHHADPRFRPLVRAGPNDPLRPMAVDLEMMQPPSQTGQVPGDRPMEERSKHNMREVPEDEGAYGPGPAVMPPFPQMQVPRPGMDDIYMPIAQMLRSDNMGDAYMPMAQADVNAAGWNGGMKGPQYPVVVLPQDHVAAWPQNVDQEQMAKARSAMTQIPQDEVAPDMQQVKKAAGRRVANAPMSQLPAVAQRIRRAADPEQVLRELMVRNQGGHDASDLAQEAMPIEQKTQASPNMWPANLNGAPFMLLQPGTVPPVATWPCGWEQGQLPKAQVPNVNVIDEVGPTNGQLQSMQQCYALLLPQSGTTGMSSALTTASPAGSNVNNMTNLASPPFFVSGLAQPPPFAPEPTMQNMQNLNESMVYTD